MRDSSTPSTTAPNAEQRVRAELAAGKLSFFLCGEKLKGSYALVRTDRPSSGCSSSTRTASRSKNDLLARHRSVLSGASLEEVAPLKVTQRLRGRRPGALRPCGEACRGELQADAGRDR